MASPLLHAKLSPSGSAKWLTCPAALQAEAEFRELNPKAVRGDSIHSIRGTQAHSVGEAFIRGEVAQRPRATACFPAPTDDEWEEMCFHGEGYAQYVHSHVDKVEGDYQGDLLLVEKRLHMAQIYKDMFGTGDVTIYKRKERHLHIIDLKYGRGEVQADGNTQLQCYALGAANMIKGMGLPEPLTFTVHIYQPRTGGTPEDSWTFSKKDLQRFTLRARDAALATGDPNPPFNPSEKACQWCDAAPTCRAFADYSITKAFDLLDLLDDITPTRVGIAIDELSERNPALMDNDELVMLRELFGASKKWMENVERYLTQETMNGTIDSLKLVEGRGSNNCIDPEAVEFMIGDIAYKPPQLKSVTDLKKIVGAKNFDHVLGDYFEKRPGKPVLVSLDDKREALKSNASMIDLLDMDDRDE